MLKKISAAADFLRSKIGFEPRVGVILGTGLNSIAEMVENPIIIPYQEIPRMSVSTAPSHEGRLIAGNIGNKKVIILQGRLHYYEGYSMEEITFPIRILNALGISHLIITNAAGSLNTNLGKGDIVLISDHINLMGSNPLIGSNFEALENRFPSMNKPYDNKMIFLANQVAEENHFIVKSGVYVAVSGPSLETRAECKMLAKMGADLVGMSTVPEVIVGVHCGMKILGISVVTNLGNIFHSEPHSQDDITASAATAKANLEILILNLIKKIK